MMSSLPLRRFFREAVMIVAFAVGGGNFARADGAGELAAISSAAPRINGARTFGVRPGNPFLFTVAATGERPMKFSAENLPAGLTLDAATGQIAGTLKDTGEIPVILHAKNARGEATGNLRIVCGDAVALTPPMGWNSWNCFAGEVDDAKVRAAADAMVSSGLANHGWTYINIDDCWQGERDEAGFIQSNRRFPDIKALGEYIHQRGLKFGIYSSPGPKTCAGYAGSYGHEDQDARRYAEWGVDYVKYDWCSYGGIAAKISRQRYAELLPGAANRIEALEKEIAALESSRRRTEAETSRLQGLSRELEGIYRKIDPKVKARVDREILEAPYRVFRASLDKVKRDIVYSLCQYGMGDVWRWGAQVGGNSWRTTSDIVDRWGSLSSIGFNQAGHEKFAGPGRWNDPDMLIVGNVGWGVKLHPTRLTPEEQFTHLSLWSLLAAPLLIGCDLTRLDEFTLGLLSNDEVLAVDQDPLGRSAGRVAQSRTTQVWARDLADGSKAVGLFNLGEKEARVTATWAMLGISGRQIVRDLWRRADVGAFDGSFGAPVPRHGVVFVRIRPAPP